MNTLMLEWATVLSSHLVLASDGTTGEGDGSLALLLLGPAGAVGVYWGLYRYYRNTDKSHDFENETEVVTQPVVGNDRKVDEVRGTRSSSIDGDNSGQHRSRVRRLG